MKIIHVRVTIPELPEAVRVSINACVQQKATPEAQVAFLQKTAKARGLNSTYELATEKEYWDYRKGIQAANVAAARVNEPEYLRVIRERREQS